MPSSYSDADRQRAAAAVVSSGTSKAAGKVCGVPASTIRHWRHNDEGFQRMCAELEAEFGEQLRAEIAGNIGLASRELRDRLENGDVVFHPKTSDLVRTPMRGKDVAVVLGICFDKLRVLEGQPTKIIQDRTSVEVLADKLAALSSMLAVKVTSGT